MMNILFRLIALIMGLWLFRRIIGAIFGSAGFRAGMRGGGGKQGFSSHSNRMVKDPVCGMYMDARLAVQLADRQGTLYFCSDECRMKYRSRPDAA